MKYRVFCDATYSLNTKNTIGIGLVIYNEANEHCFKDGILLKGKNDDININSCVAELMAIKKAIETIIKLNLTGEKFEIYSDCLPAVSHMNCNTRKKDINIKKITSDIKNLSKQFADIKFLWIQRDRNKLAHRLCRKAFWSVMVQERASNVVLNKISENKFIAESSKEGIYYIVDLDKNICTCPFFNYQKKTSKRMECKHIVAAKGYNYNL